MKDTDTKVSNKIFRNLLEGELEKRQSVNNRYSLRSYARFLEVDAPTLSKILNAKKNVGERLISRVCKKLGCDPEKINNGSDDGLSFELLSDDQSQYLSKWYYYAILEIIELDDFEYEKKWIAKKLEISEKQVKLALERMIRLGVLKEVDGKLIDNTSGKTTNISSELSSTARREHQKEILELAIDALENTPPEIRDQSSMTVSINTDDIPEVKELIKKFRRDISKFLNTANNKNQVYNLGVSFYPVTKERI